MAIEVRHVTHTYMQGTPFERTALEDVSLSVAEGSFTAIAGHTGSGKSTLAQMLAGLIQPSRGQVLVDGVDLAGKGRSGKAAAREARRKVGMVFQYPEHQLFEETLEADISFGPRNLGLSEEESRQRAREAMEAMGLDWERDRGADPFRLSGGQRRRAAIAGVLAMRPKYLVLDEPAAALDPKGRERMLETIRKLHAGGTTVILISHSMDDIARLAGSVVLMRQGRCALEGPPAHAFRQKELLAACGLCPPRMALLLDTLRQHGIPVAGDAMALDAGVAEILAAMRQHGKGATKAAGNEE